MVILLLLRGPCIPVASPFPVSVSVSVAVADHGTRDSRSLGRAGCAIVLDRPSGTVARPAQLRHRALHGTRDEVCSPGSEAGRRSHEQRGRSPPIHHPRDHAVRATLGRRDARASRRPRRPVMRKPRSEAVAEAASESVSVSVSDAALLRPLPRTLPHDSLEERANCGAGVSHAGVRRGSANLSGLLRARRPHHNRARPDWWLRFPCRTRARFSDHRPSGPPSATQRRTIGVVERGDDWRTATTPMARRRPPSWP